jgi:hypothetical protein
MKKSLRCRDAYTPGRCSANIGNRTCLAEAASGLDERADQ